MPLPMGSSDGRVHKMKNACRGFGTQPNHLLQSPHIQEGPQLSLIPILCDNWFFYIEMFYAMNRLITFIDFFFFFFERGRVAKVVSVSCLNK